MKQPMGTAINKPLPTTERVSKVLEYLRSRKETFSETDRLFEFILSVHNGQMHEAAEALGSRWNCMYSTTHIRLLIAAFLQLQKEQQDEIEAREERG